MAAPLYCNPFNEVLAAPAAGGHPTSPFTNRPEALEPAGHPNFVRALTQNDVKVTPESSDAEPDPEAVAGPVVSAPVLRRAAVDPAGGGSRRIFSPSVAHGANGCPNPARISLTRRCVVAASTAGVD